MPVVPDDTFPLPDAFGPGSVWADRRGHRSLVGHTQNGVEIPIGQGEGEVTPGELLKLALIGCAGMSSDFTIGRRLGEDFAMRLFAHATSDEATDRYPLIDEQIQLDLEHLDGPARERLATAALRSIEKACTVERTIVPGTEVRHSIDGIPSPADGSGPGTAGTADRTAAQEQQR